LLICLTLTGCKKSILDQTTSVLNRSLPDETSSNVTLTEYKENRINYTLTAAKIERFYDSRLLNAWKVKIETYDKYSKIQNTIIADTTYVDEARNIIRAMGNVIYSTPNGTIKSKLIIWDRNIDEIYTPEQVVLIRGERVMHGNNLRTNSSLSSAEMDSISAEGIITPDEINW
jgi:LPS export ABC transporter protein LptC